MKKIRMTDVRDYIRKEAGEAQAAVKDVVAEAKSVWGGKRSVGEKLNTPPAIEYSKLRRLIVAVIKVMIALELLGALIEGAQTGNWLRLGSDRQGDPRKAPGSLTVSLPFRRPWR